MLVCIHQRFHHVVVDELRVDDMQNIVLGVLMSVMEITVDG